MYARKQTLLLCVLCGPYTQHSVSFSLYIYIVAKSILGCYWPVQTYNITQATINIASDVSSLCEQEYAAAELASPNPLLADIGKTPTCTQAEEIFW
jgi:hypothetical protein